MPPATFMCDSASRIRARSVLQRQPIAFSMPGESSPGHVPETPAPHPASVNELAGPPADKADSGRMPVVVLAWAEVCVGNESIPPPELIVDRARR